MKLSDLEKQISIMTTLLEYQNKGFSILQSLKEYKVYLEQESVDSVFGETPIESIIEKIEEGYLPSEVFGELGYDDKVCSIVQAGEKGGILDKTLPHVVDYLSMKKDNYIHEEVVAYSIIADSIIVLDETSEEPVTGFNTQTQYDTANVADALEGAIATIGDPDLREAFGKVHKRYMDSANLYQTMQGIPDFFDDTTLSLIQLGEQEAKVKDSNKPLKDAFMKIAEYKKAQIKAPF